MSQISITTSGSVAWREHKRRRVRRTVTQSYFRHEAENSDRVCVDTLHSTLILSTKNYSSESKTPTDTKLPLETSQKNTYCLQKEDWLPSSSSELFMQIATNANCREYQMQTISTWFNEEFESEIGEEDRTSNKSDDDLYESIYETIHSPSESDFEDIPHETSPAKPKNPEGPSLAPGLNKLAEAAGKKMRKLRRNWSLKKNDISRSLSRIRKYSSGSGSSPTKVNGRESVPRQKASKRPSFWLPDAKSVVRHHGGPVIGDGTPGDTTFYITLTIEQDDDEYDEEEETTAADGTGYNETSSSSAIETDSRSHTFSMSGSSIRSGSSKTPDTSWTNSIFSSSEASSQITPAPRPPARKSHRLSYPVIRPTEAPPAPPVKRSQTFTAQPDSLLVCDSLQDYNQQSPVLVNPFLNSPGSEIAPGGDLMTAYLSREQYEETYTSSLFQTEPLYQFYDTESNSPPNVRYSASSEKDDTPQDLTTVSSIENMYEKVDHDNNVIDKDGETAKTSESQPEPPPTRRRKKIVSRPSAMDLIQSSASSGGRRSMWAELPEVIDSEILASISSDQKKLQEAMFEVISSEASYLKSLNVLIWHFAQSTKLIGEPPFEGSTVISKRDHRILFSDVVSVRQCSEKFLEDLEKRWQSSVLLKGLCEVVRHHAVQNFQVYVKYCSNQVYQDRLLDQLRNNNPKFVEVLRELESSPVCQSLSMRSFLMLPMQRITRLPLLLEAIFNRLNTDSEEYKPCKEALQTLSKLVSECNESARNMGRMEEMLILSQQLDFREVKALPLISASRWLVKRGEILRIWWKENAEAKLTFGRRINRQNYLFLLFTDLLVIAKKKGDDSYLVIDYCPRNFVQIVEPDTSEGVLPCLGSKSLSEIQNLSLLTLLQNHENKTVEWLISFSSECERRQWIEAVTPQTSSTNPEEKIYEEWDCPQVEAIATFPGRESDELSLEQGEKANVLRKLTESGGLFRIKEEDETETSKL